MIYMNIYRSEKDIVSIKVKVLVTCFQLFVTPWTVAHQAPLSMKFSRQEYWSVLPFPSPGDLLHPVIKPGSPALPADSLPTELQGKPCGFRFLKGNESDFHGLDFRSLILHTLFPLSHLLEHMPIWKGRIHSTLLQSPPVPINLALGSAYWPIETWESGLCISSVIISTLWLRTHSSTFIVKMTIGGLEFASFKKGFFFVFLFFRSRFIYLFI